MLGIEIPTKKPCTINKWSARRRSPPTPPPEELCALEEGFTNDAIISEKQRTKYNDTLMLKYDGEYDPHSASYFSRPDVKKQLERKKFREFPVTTWRLRPLTPMTPKCDWYQRFADLRSKSTTPRPMEKELEDSPYNTQRSPRKPKDQLNMSNGGLKTVSVKSLIPEVPLAQSPRINQNKLSYRRIGLPTPSVDKLREREKNFVNDGIPTDKKRNRFNDLIPKYDALYDIHARAYHKRQDVQKLMSVTCTLKPWEKDVKDDA